MLTTNMYEEYQSNSKFLIDSFEQFKIISLIHILEYNEMRINFIILPNNFLIGVSSENNRLYVGKIGEKEGFKADISLFYMDIKGKRKNGIYDSSFPILFQDKVFFREDNTPVFISPEGEYAKKGLYLPSSNGTLYTSISAPIKKSYELKTRRSIYNLISKSILINPQMYLIIKTIYEYTNKYNEEFNQDTFLTIYDVTRLKYNIPSYARRLRLKP